ncbi:hypothetical protein [Rhodococcus opacus]|uniref:Secreted protein n=1 Tax=Rhodococcus opacus TaxID=37919 RepID=A0A076F3J0_RHOOP|nr:hypothetical protein [Rhodococcus opacus]AII10354.1 hypothetical protein EP51_39205 [Rhodococcus opacus]
MTSTTLRTAVITIAAVPVLLIADIGTAHAYPAPTVEGGRGRIQVTAIPSSDLTHCYAKLDGGSFASPPFGGSGQSTSTLFQNVQPGPHIVETMCVNVMNLGSSFSLPVEVAAPNPILDTIDNALAGAGSSAMTTDPTLR